MGTNVLFWFQTIERYGGWRDGDHEPFIEAPKSEDLDALPESMPACTLVFVSRMPGVTAATPPVIEAWASVVAGHFGWLHAPIGPRVLVLGPTGHESEFVLFVIWKRPVSRSEIKGTADDLIRLTHF
jgi:hypothetical protein